MHTVTATIVGTIAGREMAWENVTATEPTPEVARLACQIHAMQKAGWMACVYGRAVVTLSTGEVFTLTCTS
jgi:hypothetical protein